MTRAYGRGTPDESYAGETRRNLAPFNPAARGGIFGTLFKVYGVDGEWGAGGPATSRDRGRVAGYPGPEDNSVGGPTPGVVKLREALAHVNRTFQGNGQ